MRGKTTQNPRRRMTSKIIVGAVAACATAGVVIQTTGQASAASGANKVDYLTGCPQQQACLWINAPDDPDPAKAADKRALVITSGNGPDLDEPTKYDQGKVRGVGAEFTDDISVGWNFLPYQLCLMDTTEYYGYNDFGTKAPLRTASKIITVQPGESFSRLGEWNDTIDYYTTGSCPSNLIFRADTQEIVDRWGGDGPPPVQTQ
jgi:hypothetical protein